MHSGLVNSCRRAASLFLGAHFSRADNAGARNASEPREGNAPSVCACAATGAEWLCDSFVLDLTSIENICIKEAGRARRGAKSGPLRGVAALEWAKRDPFPPAETRSAPN